MIHSAHFIGVLDTNVIYPLYIRDLLFWFAHYDLYTPKWSNHIFDEWERLMRSKGVEEADIKKRLEVPNKAFPDALVQNYEPLIDSLTLPDMNDRHVLAAAIKTNANTIVTNNIKDFPSDYLSSFGLMAKTADDFVADLIDLDQDTALEAFTEMVLNKLNPPLDELEMLDILRNNNLQQSADYLHSMI